LTAERLLRGELGKGRGALTVSSLELAIESSGLGGGRGQPAFRVQRSVLEKTGRFFELGDAAGERQVNGASRIDRICPGSGRKPTACVERGGQRVKRERGSLRCDGGGLGPQLRELPCEPGSLLDKFGDVVGPGPGGIVRSDGRGAGGRPFGPPAAGNWACCVGNDANATVEHTRSPFSGDRSDSLALSCSSARSVPHIGSSLESRGTAGVGLCCRTARIGNRFCSRGLG
jgi:hypothetical protein